MLLTRAIERFDLPAYLGRFGGEAQSGVEWELDCPICGKRKLIVNVEKRAWHCWYCQASTSQGRGGLLSLVQLLERLDKGEAARRILEGSRDYVALEAIAEQQGQALAAEIAAEIYPIDPPPHWRYGVVDFAGILPYCRKRGITYDDVRDFGLLWCDGGRYARRLVFPVWEGGALVYWQARAMWEEGEQRGGRYIKALNPPRTPGAAGATDVLFNLEVARRYPRVAIVEGPIDAIHTGRDAVCTFGKKISPVQIEKLRQAGIKAVDLMWDGPGRTEPRGAWPEMFAFAPALAQLFDVRLVFLPKGDPGDYSREQLAAIRRDCGRPFSQYQRARLQEV